MHRYAAQLLGIVWRLTKERMTRYLAAVLDLFLIIIPLPDLQISICTKLLNHFFILRRLIICGPVRGVKARLF